MIVRMQIITERIQHFFISVYDLITFSTHQMDMGTMLESGVHRFAFAEVITAGITFLPEQIQGSIHCGNINCLGVFPKLVSYLFGCDMSGAVSDSIDDHLSLGSDPVALFP